MTDALLLLDGFAFEGFEIPEGLPLGGGQTIGTKTLQGGIKVVDAMGEDLKAKQWSGRFTGAAAVDRMLAVDAIRRAGRAVSLTWGQFAWTVIVTDFSPVAESAFEIPYSITCEVIRDDSAPVGPEARAVSADQQIADDRLMTGYDMVDIADPVMIGQYATVGAAIDAVPDIARASPVQVNTIRKPLGTLQGSLADDIAATDAQLELSASLGNLQPGLPISSLVDRLTAQQAAMTRSAALYDAQAYTERMARNLRAVGTSGADKVVVGSDLFRVAEEAYGDATEWSTVARANGLTDPRLTGVQTLTIPPRPDGLGGVPNVLPQ